LAKGIRARKATGSRRPTALHRYRSTFPQAIAVMHPAARDSDAQNGYGALSLPDVG